MDYAQCRAILDKYGEDNCVQIIFDNGRVWLTKVPKLSDNPDEARKGIKMRDKDGHLVYHKFSEIVEFDEATDSMRKKEFQKSVNQKSRSLMWWWICTPLENIQGFSFLPKVGEGEPALTEEQIKVIIDNWDHCIV